MAAFAMARVLALGVAHSAAAHLRCAAARDRGQITRGGADVSPSTSSLANERQRIGSACLSERRSARARAMRSNVAPGWVTTSSHVATTTRQPSRSSAAVRIRSCFHRARDPCHSNPSVSNATSSSVQAKSRRSRRPDGRSTRRWRTGLANADARSIRQALTSSVESNGLGCAFVSNSRIFGGQRRRTIDQRPRRVDNPSRKTPAAVTWDATPSAPRTAAVDAIRSNCGAPRTR